MSIYPEEVKRLRRKMLWYLIAMRVVRVILLCLFLAFVICVVLGLIDNSCKDAP